MFTSPGKCKLVRGFRTIQPELENPLAAQLLAGELAEGDIIKIDADAHKFTFKKNGDSTSKFLLFVLNLGRDIVYSIQESKRSIAVKDTTQ